MGAELQRLNSSTTLIRKQANVMRTLAMSAGSQAKHLRRLGRHAKRRLKIDPAVVKARNVEMAAHKAAPLPAFKTQAQQMAARGPAPAGVARKKTPTQAFNRMQLSKHLAKSDPKRAIQAHKQYGQPLVGTSDVMRQLEMSAKIGALRIKLNSLARLVRKDPDKWREEILFGKTSGAERVLFKGPSLLGIKSPAKRTAAKLTTPKVPNPKTQKFGIRTVT